VACRVRVTVCVKRVMCGEGDGKNETRWADIMPIRLTLIIEKKNPLTTNLELWASSLKACADGYRFLLLVLAALSLRSFNARRGAMRSCGARTPSEVRASSQDLDTTAVNL
jgi:hypothetical protein